MTFLAPWLLAAACATGSATFVPAAVPGSQGSSSSSSSSKSTAKNGAFQPHTLGLGATFGLDFKGGGVSVRYFFTRLIGIDTRFLLTSRPNSTGHSQGLSFDFAPSLIVMLKGPDPSANVDVRPYAGAGVSITHANADSQLGFPSASGPGGQVFGGVEIQFRNADSFAMSIEVVHFMQSASLAGTTAPSGTTAVVAVHLYR